MEDKYELVFVLQWVDFEGNIHVGVAKTYEIAELSYKKMVK